MTKVSASRILTMAFVVTGNLIGAGILGLPVKTGLAGFWPSVLANILMWACMLATAFIFAERKTFTESDNADMPAFFKQELGTVGLVIGVLANLLIIYGLLVAYLSGASSILSSLFPHVPPVIGMSVFFVLASGLSIFGMEILRKGNAVLMGLLMTTFLLLTGMCLGHMDHSRLAYTDWSYVPATLPIMVTAFHFHNLIPTLCRSMDHDKAAIRKSIAIGMSIGLGMNIIWTMAVSGALPVTGDGGANLLMAFEANQPATVPLAKVIPSMVFNVCAIAFAFVAITTSYMANGTAVTSFVSDLMGEWGGSCKRFVAPVLAFAPPYAVAAYDPNLFLKALDMVGGVGICLIFGVLPSFLVIREGGKMRLVGAVLMVVFVFVLGMELAQETGMLHLQPEAEYWHALSGK